MAFPVELTALNQQLDFSSGQILNVLVIRLPNGQVVPASIDPEHVATIMTMFAERITNGGTAPPTPSAMRPTAYGEAGRSASSVSSPPVQVDPDYDDGSGTITTFGGPPPEARPVAVAAPTGPQPTTVMGVPTARSINKNEAGYPSLGGMDPSRVTGNEDDGQDRDEDGVAQA